MKTPRERAVAWARDMIEANALTVDTETLGKDPCAGLCDLSIVAMDGTVLFNSFINPGRSIPAGATAVHSITDADVAQSPSFLHVYADIVSVLGSRPVLAYNSAFDAAVLDCCCDEAEVPALGGDSWQCAMKAAADFFGEPNTNGRRPGFKWFRLSDAAARFGIETPNAHRALADCLTTLALVKAMAAAANDLPLVQAALFGVKRA